MAEFFELANVPTVNGNDPAELRKALTRIAQALKFAARHHPRLFFKAYTGNGGAIVFETIAVIQQSFRVAQAWNIATNATGHDLRINRVRGTTTSNITNNQVIAATDRLHTDITLIDDAFHDLLSGDTLQLETSAAAGNGIAYVLCVPNG